jgi:hypothetical protein
MQNSRNDAKTTEDLHCAFFQKNQIGRRKEFDMMLRNLLNIIFAALRGDWNSS